MSQKDLRPIPSAFRTAVFEPVQMDEVELSQALPPLIVRVDSYGQLYRKAHSLVRLHDVPIGVVELRLDGGDLSPAAYAEQIWHKLHNEINAHLIRDGFPALDRISAAGIAHQEEAACRRSRQDLLAPAPSISVIICTRDRTTQLATCLQHLTALQYPNYELLVVDNAPKTNDTAELIKHEYGHLANVRYVREDRPGLSRARNCGLQHAQGEIVAYIDDDERADPHWLTELVGGFSLIDNIACVTGMILPAEIETKAQEWFEQFGGHSKGRSFESVIFNTTTHAVQDPLFPAPPFGAGGNMAFRAATLRALGGFDPLLGAGSAARAAEETALFYDLLMAGYSLVFRPTAIVRHTHYREYTQLKQQLYGYGTGMTAFYTRCLLRDPRRIIDFVRLVPRGLTYYLSPHSARQARMRSDYPTELTRQQFKGMLYGPFAYLRSYLRSLRLPRTTTHKHMTTPSTPLGVRHD